MTPHELYSERAAARRNEMQRLAREERQLSLARVAAAFAAFGALFWKPLLALLPVAVFIILIAVHDRRIRARKHAERALRWYEHGIHRLEGTWSGRGTPGDSFLRPHHLYASDLDLFGSGSLYELLCVARTHAGQARLASWLNDAPSPVEEIRARQQAASELAGMTEFREALAVAGDEIAGHADLAALRSWSESPILLTSRFERWTAAVLGFLGISTFALTLPGLIARLAGMTHPESAAQLGALADIPVWPLFAIIILEMLFTARTSRRVAEVVNGVERAEESLALLARVIGVVEKQRFESPQLARLEQRLRASGSTASEEVARLHKLVALLDSRRNQFFVPFAALMLWSSNIAFALERWRARAGSQIGSWIDSVAEVEALSSLATFAFEQPGLCTPEIVEGTSRFRATGLGHPLIPHGRRVVNDVAIGDGMNLLLVSGSNMSGKSTLMRSVGVAAVLALAGSNVCARSLSISVMTIGASIRIGDSLQEGASKFYAEILRIRDVLEASKRGPMLFLLDEVLAGTNSHDRRIGAEAIVRALVSRDAIGLVSTHDLAIARVADSLAPKARNVHFADHLEGDQVVFDYRMRDGIVEKSNAVALMRSVGIEI